MKAIRYEAPGSFEVADLPIPPVGPDDVRIKINPTGVCQALNALATDPTAHKIVMVVAGG